MDPRLSIFLNSFLVMVMGACILYMTMSTLFPKRHASGVFFAYMLVKGILWSLYDISYVQGALGGLEYDFQIVATALFGVLSFAVLYYTWKASFAKIVIGGLVSDMIGSLVALSMFFVAYELFGTFSPTEYRGYFGAGTVFMTVCSVLFCSLLLRLAEPLFARFRALEFVHERVWDIVTVSFVTMITVVRMFSIDQMQETASIAVATMGLVAIGLGAYVMKRVRMERRRRELLRVESELVESYDQSIYAQLSYLEKSSAQLEEIAADVAHVEAVVDDSKLKEHVARLKRDCDGLRYGAFSDCPALDVVLSAGAKEFERRGFGVEVRVPPIGAAAVQATLLSRALLSWAIETCAGGSRELEQNRSEAPSAKSCPDVLFRIIRSCSNQLIFVLNMPAVRGRRFPRRLLERRVESFEGVILETDDAGCRTIRVMVTVDERHVDGGETVE